MKNGFTAIVLLLVLGLVAAVTGAVFYFYKLSKVSSINSFEDCAKKYPVMESYPEQCNTPDGKHFTRELSESEKQKLASRAESSNGEVINWKTYRNNKFNYLISYPDSWYIRAGEDAYGDKEVDTKVDTLDNVLLTVNPPCKTCGGYPIGVYIQAEENNAESVSTYVEKLVINYREQKNNLEKEVVNIDGNEITIIKGIIPSKKIAVLKKGNVLIAINFDQIEGINENKLSSNILSTFKFLK